MIYVAFLTIFLGELAGRAIFGIPFAPTTAFWHGVLAGLAVLGLDIIQYVIRQFRQL